MNVIKHICHISRTTKIDYRYVGVCNKFLMRNHFLDHTTYCQIMRPIVKYSMDAVKNYECLQQDVYINFY